MIRRYRSEDAAATYGVYADAVLNGTAPHYTADQARAWVPSDEMEDWWPPRLAGGTAWVAEGDAELTGLISLMGTGYLDMFFVRPSARPAGTAARLYNTLAAHARAAGQARLTTHASHLARRFLERRGWHVVAEETAMRNGVPLTRFAMESGGG
ncbi:GNAT family N-acetyltransferase [Rhodobacteraceae bacterium CCMM004]|nr:GNAT family N-acetyltransferase [Rhodobacteraceae bacterium CCMM004]